ncbi:MAG: nitrogen regulation protein NR(II) [Halobacteriales archaeon]
MGSTSEDDMPEHTVDSRQSIGPDRLIEETFGHAVFLLDPGGHIETWPEPAIELYGFEPATVLGRSLVILFADEGGQDRPLGELLAEAEDGGVESDAWHARADGSVFWASVTFSPIHDGELLGYAVVSRDRTETKEYEQMLERQNDRLKEFTDILAHDLRNPLNTIGGYLDLYEQTGNDEHITEIKETTARMERLVDDLLRVAHQGDVVKNPEPTDIADVIDSAWQGTGKSEEGATLTYESVPSLSADADRLCELFENLFRNSIEHGAMDNQEDTGVTVRVGPLPGGFYVEDDGPGIPEELRETAFDHGVSTSGDGSGYGLSIVRTVANAHGWDVIATEAASGGARFEITGIDALG